MSHELKMVTGESPRAGMVEDGPTAELQVRSAWHEWQW